MGTVRMPMNRYACLLSIGFGNNGPHLTALPNCECAARHGPKHGAMTVRATPMKITHPSFSSQQREKHYLQC